MALVKEFQINIIINNYAERSSSYSSTYDYILLDDLANCSYSNLFREDFKNLKIKDSNNNDLKVLYIPSYSSQSAVMLVRVPVGEISQNTKLTLAVHDTATTFSNSLSVGGAVQFFDANHDTFSDFFESSPGISVISDTIDSGKVIRSQFVPQQFSGLFTKNCSGHPIANGRVVVARFKRAIGGVNVNDSYDCPYPENPAMNSAYLQFDYNLSGYGVDMQVSMMNYTDGATKDYCMLNGVCDIIMCSSWDNWNSGSDDEGDWKQYHIHNRAATGFSDSADYLEGSLRNNYSHVYETDYHEVMINASGYATAEHDEFNYIDLKWLLVFPSPIFAFNNIPTITVTEKDSKHGIRLYKGKYEYPKAYKGSKLLWDANDENLKDTGLHIPDKIINKDWDWVL